MQELRQRFTTVARNMGVVSLVWLIKRIVTLFSIFLPIVVCLILMQLMGNFPVLTLPSLLLLGHAFLPDAAAIDADPTSEQEGSSIADPKLECTPYIYPAVANQMSAFPPIGSRASILPNDSAALDKWNSISGSIPTGIGIKTQPPGDNYPPTDPDCWWTYRQCTNPKVEGIPPDLEAAPEPSTLGYSFDDGPSCSHNVFLDFLQSQRQKATFYFIGSNVASYPTQAQRALADGHEICIHSWSHPYMTTLSSEDAFAEMWYSVARQIIKIALGVSPTCWRPPFGDVDDRIRAIANALELRCDMWDYDSGDASVNGQSITEETVENNYNSFLQTASSGAFNLTGTIFLMHELNNFTMSEAMKYYTRISSAFRYIVPIGVSLNKTQPYLEPNYSMPTFEQYASGTLTVNPSTSHTTSSTTPDDSPTSGQSAASANSARGVAMEFLSAQVLLAVLAVLFTSQRST